MPQNGNSNDCTSELSAFLKPIYGKSPVKWAIEASLTGGQMDNSTIDRTFNNQMILLGLDFSSGAHQLYLEGGAKFWHRSDEDASISGGSGKSSGNSGSAWSNSTKSEKRHWGMRELFYGNYHTNTKVKLGLQSMRLGNSMLLDERVLGASLNQNIGAFTFDLKIGTVSTDFSRQGDFCGTRHVYRLLRGGRFNFVSPDLWKTNFVGAIITWDPSYVKPSDSSDDFSSDDGSGDDDFSSDGFEDFSDFEETKRRLIKNISLILFEEYGSDFHEYKYYFGILAKFSLPALIELETEVIQQHIKDERSLAYRFQLSRDWTWASGALTNLSMSYLGKHSFDDQSKFYPAFSNLLLGEVMKIDAQDSPFWFASVKHDFPIKLKPAIKVFYVGQTEDNHLSELDIQLSAKVYKGLRLYAMYSLIETDLLEGDTDTIRLEVKWTF